MQALDEQTRNGLNVVDSRGWLLQRHWANAEQLAGMRQDLSVLMNDSETFENCLYFFDQADSGDCRLARIERLWEAMPSLVTSGLGAQIEQSAAHLLGSKPVLFKDKLNIRYPRSSGYAPHQDSAAGWDRYVPRSVTFSIFITASNAARGGFEIVSGRHREGRLPNVNGRMDRTLFDAMAPEAVEAAAGDVIILDSETPHRTVDNQSSDTSLHLFFTFAPACAAGARHAYYERKIESFAANRIGTGNRFAFRVFEF